MIAELLAAGHACGTAGCRRPALLEVGTGSGERLWRCVDCADRAGWRDTELRLIGHESSLAAGGMTLRGTRQQTQQEGRA